MYTRISESRPWTGLLSATAKLASKSILLDFGGGNESKSGKYIASTANVSEWSGVWSEWTFESIDANATRSTTTTTNAESTLIEQSSHIAAQSAPNELPPPTGYHSHASDPIRPTTGSHFEFHLEPCPSANRDEPAKCKDTQLARVSTSSEWRECQQLQSTPC